MRRTLYQAEWSTAVVRESHKDTVIGWQAQKESSIIILLTPAPMIDPFPAWWLKLCLYGIREQHHDLNQSEHSITMALDQ